MTQYSYPWTAVAGDRTRTADTAADIYNSLNPTGVMDGLTCALSGGNVTVSAGTANVEGRYYRNTATVTLTPEASKKSYVVLRMDATSRDVSVALLAGTNTALPTLTQTAALYEVALAAVDTTLVPATVTDTRYDASVCGVLAPRGLDSGWLVAGIVNYRKIGSTVYAQWYRNTNIAAGATVTVGTLPAGYRPTMTTAVSCSRALQGGTVSNTGVISITNSDSVATTHFGSVTFAI